MKLVFFGTSSFGLPSLEAISKSGHHLSAIVTTPDKPQGRNLKLLPSPVKGWSLSHGVKVLEASKQNISDLEAELKKMAADVFVVISFGVLLPPSLLAVPKKAALNVHSSLLPRHRGPAPVHWAILLSDRVTGVTVMRMAKALDTGDILLQKETPISPRDNEQTLHGRLAVLGAEALLQALSLLEKNKAQFTPQEEKHATYARKITKDDGRVQWKESAEAIHNRVRALAGWPGTFTFLNGKRIILHKTSVETGKPSSATLGKILEASAKQGILVAAQGSVLRLEELQLEGKKPLSAALFVQGGALKAGDVLE